MLPLPPWMPTTPAIPAAIQAAIASLGLTLAAPSAATSSAATPSAATPSAATPSAATPSTSTAPIQAEPAPPAGTRAPVPKDMSPGSLAVGPEQALETVLECGLRVRIARDRTLPVAAVVLAVETGPEDDPPELPGLTHALAYQILQGNRELRPGEAVEIVHGGGGVASLAIGHAQVRYESLVPASRLAQTLWIESQRLRFPTPRASTWKQALGWAQADGTPVSLLPADARAAVHHTPGLGHDGRRVGDGLRELPEAAIAVQIRSRFDYSRATLVVVAPEEPAAVLAIVEPLFADLPRTTRRAAVRLPGVSNRARGDGESTPPATEANGTTPANGGATPANGAATPAATTGTDGAPPAPTPSKASGAGKPVTGPAGAVGKPVKGSDSAAAAKGSDGAAKGSDPAAKGSDPAAKGSDPAAKGSDPAAKGSDPAASTAKGSAASTSAKGTGDSAPPPATGADLPAGTGAGSPGEAADDVDYPLPETVLAGTQRFPLLAWSIPGTPEAQAWAVAVCRALGRQRRVADEDKKLKVSCVVDPDPRRASLLVQVTGTEDLVGAVTARLRRLLGRERSLLATQGTVLAGELRVARSRPLELARQLAAGAESAGPAQPQVRDLDAITGAAALADPAELTRVFPSIADCGGAVLLIRREAPKP